MYYITPVNNRVAGKCGYAVTTCRPALDKLEMGLQLTADTVFQLPLGGSRITLDEILLQAENAGVFLPEQLKHLVVRIPFALLVDIEEPYIIAHHFKVVMKLLAVIGEPDEVCLLY